MKLQTSMIVFKKPGFLKSFLCKCLYVCLCSLLRLLLTSDVIWIPYNWLNKFYSCYVAIVVGIVNGHGLGIKVLIETSLIIVNFLYKLFLSL